MAPTPNQRETFGRRLRELRQSRDLTQRVVIAAMVECDGYEVTPQAFGQWENGIGSPDRQNAVALAKVFDEPDYSLAEILGYRGDDPTIRAELDEIRERIKVLEQMLRDFLADEADRR